MRVLSLSRAAENHKLGGGAGIDNCKSGSCLQQGWGAGDHPVSLSVNQLVHDV